MRWKLSPALDSTSLAEDKLHHHRLKDQQEQKTQGSFG